MGAGIIALFTALPELLKLVEQAGPELVSLVKNFAVYINHVSGNDPQGYIKQVGAAFAQGANAKTIQERQDAAKAIADAVHGLP